MSSRAEIALKLSPLLLPFLVIIAGGFAFTVAQSIGFFTPVPAEGPPFAAYLSLLTDAWFYRSAGYSIYVAFSSALLSVVFGTLIAYGIWRLPSQVRSPAIVHKLPLILPHVAVAFIILVLFSKTGVIASIAYHFGMIIEPREFPNILFGGNGVGLILAYVYKETPFVILMTYAVFSKIDERQLTTARLLGGSQRRIFFSIVLPFVLPAVNTTFIVLFLYAFGAFDIPFLLSESSPQMLSIYVFNTYFRRDLSMRPYAMAALVLMFVFSAGFIYLYGRVVRSLSNTERKV